MAARAVLGVDRRPQHRVPDVGGLRVEPASEKLDARDPRKKIRESVALKYLFEMLVELEQALA